MGEGDRGRPADRGGRPCGDRVSTYPQAGLVRLVVDGDLRLQIRPSGTEPKVKLYGEGVDVEAGELQSILDAAARIPSRNLRTSGS